MTEPIFKSIVQAVHVSFLMEIVIPSTKGQTEICIQHLMESSGHVFQGIPEPVVNTKGMRQEDWFAQCALIRQKVEERLPPPERDAIWARYGQYDSRINVFTKSDGIEGMAIYVESVSKLKGDALLELTANFYGLCRYNKKGRKIAPPSLRDIADRYNKSRVTLAQVKQVIGRYAAGLEMEAMKKLSVILNNEITEQAEIS